MKIFRGVVVRKTQTKTASVQVDSVKTHPVYKKRFKTAKIYHVHDEQDKTNVGDKVRFVASKPFSKTKKWKLYVKGDSQEKQETKKTKKPAKSKGKNTKKK